jgi:arylsulfatase A-like enzyme
VEAADRRGNVIGTFSRRMATSIGEELADCGLRIADAADRRWRMACWSLRGGCAGVLVLLLLGTAALAAGGATKEVALRLGDEREGERFAAALELLERWGVRESEAVRDALAEAAVRAALDATPAGRAARDFVVEALAGKRRRAGAARGVLLVSIDTLRADHLGCYGYERATSPAIDRLARRGALFRNAWSTSSWTLPAHMSMLTSLYPSFHKLEKGGSLGSVRLDESETTLAGVLRSAGFATAGLVAHPYLSAEWGFDRGFDVYRRYSTRAAAQTERARRWLDWHLLHAERGLHRPDFFLFLHYLDPHEPYDAPDGYAARFFPDYAGPLRPSSKLVTLFAEQPFADAQDLRYALALYDGEIAYADAHLGELWRSLEERGLADSTLVVLTSDHGEEMKDHGSMGHKETLYEEVLRVPLIVVAPGAVEAGRSIDAPVSILDIAPTILDLTASAPLAKAQGTSLRPLMSAGSRAAAAPPAARFAELGPMQAEWERSFRRRAARSGALKLIVNYEAGGNPRRELYDLQRDPGERRDLWAARRDEKAVRRLAAALDDLVRAGSAYNPAFPRQNEIEIDDATRQRLKALGYVE